MRRLYLSIILDHFKQNEQMLFLVGPRQVGKTTIALSAQEHFAESRYFT
jgi:predicted AAA+ superfamily ATPase